MSLTPSSNLSLNLFSSSEDSKSKPGTIKMGTREVTYITSTKDMFYKF
jgi:hypothetical protein